MMFPSQVWIQKGREREGRDLQPHTSLLPEVEGSTLHVCATLKSEVSSTKLFQTGRLFQSSGGQVRRASLPLKPCESEQQGAPEPDDNFQWETHIYIDDYRKTLCSLS